MKCAGSFFSNYTIIVISRKRELRAATDRLLSTLHAYGGMFPVNNIGCSAPFMKCSPDRYSRSAR
jgi:hypothetical protein